MTNEELARTIQSGNHECIPILWERCRKIIYKKAIRFKNLHENCNQEVDDLVQSGFFAMIAAIGYYNPDKPENFLTYLNKPLLNEFLRASGWRTSKRDALDYAISIDTPTDEDGETTLADIIPGNDTPMECELYYEELAGTIREALAKLPKRKEALIRAIYFEGMTITAAGRMLGYNPTAANNAHRDALCKLRRGAYTHKLRSFLYETK